MSQKFGFRKWWARMMNSFIPRKSQGDTVARQRPTFAERLLIQQATWPKGEHRVIELIGGPLDGHRECIDANEVHSISSKVAFTIGPETFRFLAGHQRTYGSTATSWAIYELLLENDRWLYRFVQQVAPSDSRQETLS